MWVRPLGEAVLVALVTWELLPLTWRCGPPEPLRVPTRGGWHRPRHGRPADRGGSRGRHQPAHRDGDRPHIVLRAADEIGTWLVATSATVGSVLLGRHWRGDRRPYGDPLDGWLATGAVAAWLAVVPSSLDLVDWTFSGRDVVSALLLLATVPLLVVGASGRGRPARVAGLVQTSHGSWSGCCWRPGSSSCTRVSSAGSGACSARAVRRGCSSPRPAPIALIAEPARHRIQRLVDRLVYGARDDPLGVVQRVVDHVGADAGDELLPALVTSLERELRLDAVAIDVAAPGGWRRGRRPVPNRTPSRGRCSGTRRGRRPAGRRVDHGPSIRPRDRQILDQLVGPLGLAVGWVRLAADLRRSSVAVVSAREEERRRLRRDLHDGLGPTLTGVSLGLRTAVRQLDRSIDDRRNAPPRELLGRLADEVDSVVLELKRIVRDLRPTALDQLGLVGAVAEFTRKFDGDLEIHLALPTEPIRCRPRSRSPPTGS